MTETEPTTIKDGRATDWRILDGPRPDGTQVHVGQVIHVNGEVAAIHLHPEEPIVVLTNGDALRSETLLRLTVHAADVDFALNHHSGETAPDRLGGIPVRVPPAHAERSWCRIRSRRPLPVIPNGSHFPRGDGDGAPMASVDWVRLHVQVASVAFGYEGADDNTTDDERAARLFAEARLRAITALLDETDAAARENQHLARLSTRQIRDLLP